MQNRASAVKDADLNDIPENTEAITDNVAYEMDSDEDESSDDADAPEKGEDGEVIPGEDDSDDYERLCNICPPPGEQVRTDHSDAWRNQHLQ